MLQAKFQGLVGAAHSSHQGRRHGDDRFGQERPKDRGSEGKKGRKRRGDKGRWEKVTEQNRRPDQTRPDQRPKEWRTERDKRQRQCESLGERAKRTGWEKERRGEETLTAPPFEYSTVVSSCLLHPSIHPFINHPSIIHHIIPCPLS